MVLESCCCCVDEIFGVFFVASVQIVEGLGSLGFGTTWDTVLITIVFLLAGMCLMDGIIRRNPSSTLANVILSVFGMCLIAASTIKFIIMHESAFLGNKENEDVAIARLLYLIFIPIDIYFLIYVYNIYKKLKPKKEEEEDCTKIIF